VNSMSDRTRERIIELIKEGEKVEACKLYRQETGASLLDSKSFVDDLAAQNQAESSAPINDEKAATAPSGAAIRRHSWEDSADEADSPTSSIVGALFFALVALIVILVYLAGPSGNNPPSAPSLSSAASPESANEGSASPSVDKPTQRKDKQGPSPAESDPHVYPGDQAIVDSRAGMILPLTTSRELLNQWIRAASLNDEIGVKEIQESDGIFYTPQRTRVLLLEVKGEFPEPLVAKVRVLEGRQLGRTGWVQYDWLRSR